MFRKLAEEELNFENKKLDMLLKQAKVYPRKLLFCSATQGKSVKFYYSEPGSKKRIYIRRSDSELLRNITYGAVVAESIRIIKRNISSLEGLMTTFKSYFYENVLDELPKAYQHAVDYLKTSAPPPKAVIQSENPFKPEELKHTASNGLKVRSKGELIITEELTSFDLDFRYEMALKLIEKVINPDGTIYSKTVTKYPDFTIFLKDGSVIYWEHLGKFNNEGYRFDQFKKFQLYYDNDIYPPKNLIITMDDEAKPLDILTIRRIIQNMVQLFC
ncbi:MAG: hypothetical protein IJL49_05060 [Firmicutes bacterium]|nr:hypothetical protein [Bacillota bacterium]